MQDSTVHHHSATEIIKIFHSITSLELDSTGCLEVGFDFESDRSALTSFQPGSFTRLVLELVEAHLNKEPGIFIGKEEEGV